MRSVPDVGYDFQPDEVSDAFKVGLDGERGFEGIGGIRPYRTATSGETLHCEPAVYRRIGEERELTNACVDTLFAQESMFL